MNKAADSIFMARALQLAERGLFTTTPNPRVGCVIVQDGLVIAEGWHMRAGEPHAEVMALRSPVGADDTLLKTSGSTAYVTLEPCSHFGKTPPCADALIAAGVSRVVSAMQDPNPLVAGQGLAKLRAAGIAVECGLLEHEARELNIGFVSRMTRGRPWLRVKIAASIDGKTALNNGVSQWITGEVARRNAHLWRARSCAILTGIGSVKHDNPRLTVRDVSTTRQPLRVLLDSHLQTSPDAAILHDGGALIFCAVQNPLRQQALENAGAEVLVIPNADGRVDLPAMLQVLGQRGVNEILVEAGSVLNGALLAENLVDELLIYQAPTLIGEAARGMFAIGEITQLGDAKRLHILERRTLGDDSLIRARFVAN